MADIKKEHILEDRKERDLIEGTAPSSLDESYFVEAGAGSGKTEGMSRRLVALITSGKAGIEEVAAITFTRKAASELKERFQVRLEEAAADVKLTAKKRELAEKALRKFELASVSTVHSFCAKLLRERPVEAGVDPGFEEMEENDDGKYMTEVWAEYVNRQYAEYKEKYEGVFFFEWLSSHGLDVSSAAEVYKALVEYPDVAEQASLGDHPDLQAVMAEARKFTGKAKSMFRGLDLNADIAGLKKDMRMLLKALFKYESIGFLESEAQFVKVLKLFAEDEDNTEPARGVPSEIYRDYFSFKTAYVLENYRKWLEHIHLPLMVFAKQGAEYYQRWRADRSLLNFQDLLMKSTALLAGNDTVRQYFNKKLKYLLVDEFQDTDPIQAELIFLLTGEKKVKEGWRGMKPRPGSLFLVGDPKQSIYRFRRADIGIYEQVKKLFPEKNVLKLTVNFRSNTLIENITNEVFESAFGPDKPFQAGFAPMKANDLKKYAHKGVFYHVVPRQFNHSEEGASEVAAGVAAKWIASAIKGKLKELGACKPGDFLILTRTKKHLSEYARALERYNILYDVSGGQDFGESTEIKALALLLKAVSDYMDQPSIVGALRSIFFGISDNELYEHVKAGGKFGYVAPQKEGTKRVNDALAKLLAFRRYTEQYDPLTALYFIMEDTGIIPYTLSGELGAGKTGNIFKAVELIRRRKAGAIGTFAELADMLVALSTGEEEVDETSMLPGVKTAVRIMNLHKAKGLEARFVILADPLKSTREHPIDRHVKRAPEGNIGYFSVGIPNGEYHTDVIALPVNWAAQEEEAKQYSLAEEARLDYVAVTRAKEAVLVFLYPIADVDAKGKSKPIEKIEQRMKWYRFRNYAITKGEELKLPEVELESAPPVTVTEKELAAEKEEIKKRLIAAAVAGYKVTTVTALVKAGGSDDKRGYGEGAAWGSIVHKALEACGKGKRPVLDKLAVNWMAEAGLPAERIKKLLILVDAVMSGDIWKRALKADKCLFEVPFSVKEGDMVINGAIDLVFLDAKGWHIYDYKTDDYKKDPARWDSYKKQIALYAEKLAKITGKPVADQELIPVRV